MHSALHKIVKESDARRTIKDFRIPFMKIWKKYMFFYELIYNINYILI